MTFILLTVKGLYSRLHCIFFFLLSTPGCSRKKGTCPGLWYIYAVVGGELFEGWNHCLIIDLLLSRNTKKWKMHPCYAAQSKQRWMKPLTIVHYSTFWSSRMNFCAWSEEDRLETYSGSRRRFFRIWCPALYVVGSSWMGETKRVLKQVLWIEKKCH